MKLLVLILILFPFTRSLSQDIRIGLSVKKEKLFVKLNEDNSNKVFTIKSANAEANNNFVASVINEVISKDWKRTFTIHNNADSTIDTLSYTTDDKYCISLKLLSDKLKSGNEYYLYTIALPTDPKKAMLVKVARNLVCKITIED